MPAVTLGLIPGVLGLPRDGPGVEAGLSVSTLIMESLLPVLITDDCRVRVDMVAAGVEVRGLRLVIGLRVVRGVRVDTGVRGATGVTTEGAVVVSLTF